jgi:hypothetical protein
MRGVGNQGGFRTLGRPLKDSVKLVVLYTTGAEPDWPDALDVHTGAFTYFGDNRSRGRELHDTPRKGNMLLRRLTLDQAEAKLIGAGGFYRADLGDHVDAEKGSVITVKPDAVLDIAATRRYYLAEGDGTLREITAQRAEEAAELAAAFSAPE